MTRLALTISFFILTVFGLPVMAAEDATISTTGTNGTVTARDRAAASLDAFNQVFYMPQGDRGCFRHSTTNSRCADFWKFAEEIEMVVDAQEHYPAPDKLEEIDHLMKGFQHKYGRKWMKNPFNDDIMWMCIASLRAYEVTGEKHYRDLGKKNFDLCYARGWDTNFTGGGMYWKVDRKCKNSCVNGPAAIAAGLLWRIYGDNTYSNEAAMMMDWEKAVISNGRGRIYDNIGTNGHIAHVSFTYNEGTYIGACDLLGRVEDARAAADFTRDHLCEDSSAGRILPQYNYMGDLAGFNGIFVRWMARFMRDQHLEGDYANWLQANAEAAWSVRRATDGLSWGRWLAPTPTGDRELESWGCSDSVVILQVAP